MGDGGIRTRDGMLRSQRWKRLPVPNPLSMTARMTMSLIHHRKYTDAYRCVVLPSGFRHSAHLLATFAGASFAFEIVPIPCPPFATISQNALSDDSTDHPALHTEMGIGRDRGGVERRRGGAGNYHRLRDTCVPFDFTRTSTNMTPDQEAYPYLPVKKLEEQDRGLPTSPSPSLYQQTFRVSAIRVRSYVGHVSVASKCGLYRSSTYRLLVVEEYESPVSDNQVSLDQCRKSHTSRPPPQHRSGSLHNQ